MLSAIEAGSGVTGVVASGYSGLELAGTVGGIVGTVVAIVALILTVAAGNAKRRRQYEDDIRAAEQRGRDAVADDLTEARHERDEMRAERDQYRERYLHILERDQQRRGGQG